MLPLTSLFCDVLPAKSDDPEYYKSFLTQYTLITVPAIYSQAIITPESAAERVLLNDQVDNFITELPKASLTRRRNFPYLTGRALMPSSAMIQDQESRTFVSAIFIEKAIEHKITNLQMILSAQNASAFLNYFGLLEDTINRIHVEKCGEYQGEKKILGSGTIYLYLNEILNKEKIKGQFVSELAKRSEFFLNFKVLESTWSLLSLIRNTVMHEGGNFSKEKQKAFRGKVENIIKSLSKHNVPEMSVEFLHHFESVENEIKSTGRIRFNDALENCIRNTCIWVMESLLLSERTSSRKLSSQPKAPKKPQQARKPPVSHSRDTSHKAKKSAITPTPLEVSEVRSFRG